MKKKNDYSFNNFKLKYSWMIHEKPNETCHTALYIL